ncbi:MAG: CopD family protein [Pseudomonadota bacterium]
MDGIVLLLHVLGATIWTGGHIVLSIVVLPKVLKEKNPAKLLEFESVYEKIGMPSLILQVVTGILLAFKYQPEFHAWFDLSNNMNHPILTKLGLLLLTLSFAVHARFRVIPYLSEKNLVLMSWHIVPVTIISILLVVVGVSFRTGWLY